MRIRQTNPNGNQQELALTAPALQARIGMNNEAGVRATSGLTYLYVYTSNNSKPIVPKVCSKVFTTVSCVYGNEPSYRFPAKSILA